MSLAGCSKNNQTEVQHTDLGKQDIENSCRDASEQETERILIL